MVRLLLSVLLCCAVTLPARADDLAQAKELTSQAEAFLWFALNEQGDREDFAGARELLAAAQQRLEQVAPSPAREVLGRAQAALAEDIEQVQAVFADKLGLHLPLVRFMGPSLLVAPRALGTYELFDDPAETAVGQAVAGIMAQSSWISERRAQIDVLFATVPSDPGLEREALAVFNQDPRYFARTEREVVSGLSALDRSGTLADRLTQADITAEMRLTLLNALGLDRFLLVTLRRQASEGGLHFFIAEATLQSAEGVTQRADVMGFGRDRTAELWPLAGAQFALLCVALGLHRWRRGAGAGLQELLAPTVAFLLGRMAPWGVLPALGTVKPQLDTLLVLGVWWPLVAGMALLLLPLVLMATAGRRLGPLATYLSLGRGFETLAIAIALGVTAWWATPIFVYAEDLAYLLVPLAALGLVSAAVLLSRGVRGVSLLGGLLLLVALSIALPSAEWIYLAPIAVLGAVAALWPIRKGAVAVSPVIDSVERPSYRPFGVLPRLLSLTRPLGEGRSVWLLLSGPAGSGKSHHAQALVETLRQETGPPLVLLQGACQALADGATSIPYAPFQRAIAEHLSVDLGAAGKVAGDVEQGVYDLLLGPLAPLFKSGGGPAASANDLHHFLARELKRQAEKQRIVLLIEDAQWLDEASRSLLTHLRQVLPPEGPVAFMVLLVCRDDSAPELIGAFNLASAVVPVTALKEAEQRELLQEGCRLSHETASWVIEWLGSQRQGAVAGDLVAVVEDLKRAGALQAGAKGLSLVADFDRQRPPLSASALEEAKQAVTSLPEAREILAVAGCLGRRFEATLVSQALEQSRTETLRRLEAVESASGILRDVREVDDLYEFRAQRSLEAIREVLQLRLAGPNSAEVPQAVRETHAQVARALEPRADNSLADLLRVALHYYGAGRRYAEKALSRNLEATQRLARLLRFEEAARFLEQASDYAPFLRREAEIEAARLVLDSDRAHISGKGARPVADKGLAWLKHTPNASPQVILSIARACYEASRDGGPSLLSEAERLGLEVEASAAAPLIRAQGLHFAGLALRFDESRLEECRARLAKALAVAESCGHEGTWLVAQVANSLGLVESGRGPAGLPEAERLIRRSIALKQAQEIPDLPGLARSYGGLGYLLLESGDRTRLQEAEVCFRKDLEIAREIGDLAGQAKARLWLGQSHLRQSEWTAAASAFEAVRDLAVTPGDRATAAAGLLQVRRALLDRAGFLQVAEGVVADFAKVPGESRQALQQALQWPEVVQEAVVITLLQRLEAP